ncbi:MAG: MBOAT family O-acyltransferase [Nanoarchaeota archaeon]
MLFNSLHFLLFFPIVVIVYFSISHKYRWILLLISSYYFYMSWKAEYIILIMISTLIDYVSGIQIYNSKTQKRKKIYLVLSLLSNLGLLFVFKYLNFFSDSVRTLLQQFSIQLNPITLKVLLPVGISFYTFQTLSYTIDVYRGKIQPQRHLGIFAVYVSFFPQLVAGPIERAKNLLPQFFEKHYFDYKRITDGLKLMLWGFFKKVVIADRLSIIVNTIYNNPTDYTGITLILATVFFAFQIYCDFSGYSDIAIGAAQIMGFKLMDNFKRPYFSRSISEFWKRWHISLSSWFKDYVYIPLGGNKVSIPRWYVNLLIVFLISGLWHGANWTFVIWGALHGFYLISEIITKPLKNKLLKITKLVMFPKIIRLLEIGFTFTLVNIGWIFFRANNVSDAFYILTNIFTGFSLNISGINIGVSWVELWSAFGVIGFMVFVHIIQEHRSVRQFLDNKPLLLRWSIYMLLLWMILFLGIFTEQQFIYFQF